MKGIDELEQYAYELPSELIAQEPLVPRDSSRLLIVEKGALADSTFANLTDALPQGALLVMNETKVVPARIVLAKSTGGKVEILFYVNLWNGIDSKLTGISDRKLSVGNELYLGQEKICDVVDQDENIFSFNISIVPAHFLELLEKHGVMPLPKYIKDSKLGETERKERYQTTFAKNAGSVAAPTASLHFTPELFDKLKEKGVEIARLTLHVGAGTFAPVTDHEIASGKLHTEHFLISRATLEAVKKAKQEGRAVIPVGTTALRALESIHLGTASNDIVSTTNIFIRKPYAFKIADGLITNFHVPRSSLMCLVDAFLDFKKSPKGILDIYRHAIKNKYRFYSFGDGMLIL